MGLNEVGGNEPVGCVELGGFAMRASVFRRPCLSSAMICAALVFCAMAHGASVGGRPVRPIQGRSEVAYYAGESLRVGQREIPLFRSREKVAILHRDGRGLTAVGISDVVQAGNRSYRVERRT